MKGDRTDGNNYTFTISQIPISSPEYLLDRLQQQLEHITK